MFAADDNLNAREGIRGLTERLRDVHHSRFAAIHRWIARWIPAPIVLRPT
jgi:hypothetical protein